MIMIRSVYRICNHVTDIHLENVKVDHHTMPLFPVVMTKFAPIMMINVIV